MERGDDIAKVGRTLIGMEKEHEERDFILDSLRRRHAAYRWSPDRRDQRHD